MQEQEDFPLKTVRVACLQWTWVRSTSTVHSLQAQVDDYSIHHNTGSGDEEVGPGYVIVPILVHQERRLADLELGDRRHWHPKRTL